MLLLCSKHRDEYMENLLCWDDLLKIQTIRLMAITCMHRHELYPDDWDNRQKSVRNIIFDSYSTNARWIWVLDSERGVEHWVGYHKLISCDCNNCFIKYQLWIKISRILFSTDSSFRPFCRKIFRGCQFPYLDKLHDKAFIPWVEPIRVPEIQYLSLWYLIKMFYIDKSICNVFTHLPRFTWPVIFDKHTEESCVHIKVN